MKVRRPRRPAGLVALVPLLLVSNLQHLLLAAPARTPAAKAAPQSPAPTSTPSVPAAGARAPPPTPVAPAFDEDLTKELGKGILLNQLERKDKLPKRPFAAPERLVRPYSGASLGAPVAYQLVQGTEFASAPAAQALAQSVVDRLLKGIKVPQPNIRVLIVAEPSYGAQAMETGLILVSLGTFNPDPTKGAASVDELALLLGHEVSHLLLGHMDKGRTMRGLVRALGYSASAFMSYSAVKDSRMVNGRFEARGDKGMIMRGLVGGLAASTLVGDLLTPSFDRGRELEADRLGVDLARRAQYVVTEGEVRNFVSRHAEDNLRRSQRMQNLQTVLNVLTAEAGSALAQQVGDKGNLVKGLISVVGGMLTEQLVKAIASQTRNHPNVEERKTFVVRYVQANYPDGDTGPGGQLLRRDVTGIRSVGGAPGFAATLEQVRRANDVRRLLSEAVPTSGTSGADPLASLLRDTGAARAAASNATTPRKGRKAKPRAPAPAPQGSGAFGTDAAAFTWEMQGLVQMTRGDAGGAQVAWRRGLRSDYASLEMARRLGDAAPGTPPTAEIDGLVSRYNRLIGTSDPVLDLVVAAAMAKGQVAAAEMAAARCVTYDGGRLYPRCAALLGYNPLVKGTPAKTPEGAKAFAGKSMEKSFRDLLSITEIFQ
jgi:Zn-dependent protease with chaperone function